MFRWLLVGLAVVTGLAAYAIARHASPPAPASVLDTHPPRGQSCADDCEQMMILTGSSDEARRACVGRCGQAASVPPAAGVGSDLTGPGREIRSVTRAPADHRETIVPARRITVAPADHRLHQR